MPRAASTRRSESPAAPLCPPWRISSPRSSLSIAPMLTPAIARAEPVSTPSSRSSKRMTGRPDASSSFDAAERESRRATVPSLADQQPPQLVEHRADVDAGDCASRAGEYPIVPLLEEDDRSTGCLEQLRRGGARVPPRHCALPGGSAAPAAR